jgi:hypothetical protein
MSTGHARLPEPHKQQEQRHLTWREFRDTWRDEFNDEGFRDEKDKWEEQLKSVQPNPALETWYARQIARLDAQRAAELLRNDLYAVRRGAWLGFAQSGDAERVGWLIGRHAKEDNPLFRFALYRAIDRLLQRLEVVGNAEDLNVLNSLHEKWRGKLEQEPVREADWTAKRRVQQTILERIEWTIPVVKSRVGPGE